MSEETTSTIDAKTQAGVATAEQNAALEHSDSGKTTRDGLDAGVPMIQGDPTEPTGPEDAFGKGPKRGDYAERTGGVNSLVSRPAPNAGQPITKWTDDKTGAPASPNAKGATEHVVDYEPHAVLEPQVPNVLDRGEVAGLKGGVDTDPAAISNPAVQHAVRTALAQDSTDASSPATSDGSPVLTADDLTGDELDAIAKRHEVSTSGSKADVIERIAEKRT